MLREDRLTDGLNAWCFIYLILRWLLDTLYKTSSKVSYTLTFRAMDCAMGLLLPRVLLTAEWLHGSNLSDDLWSSDGLHTGEMHYYEKAELYCRSVPAQAQRAQSHM